MAETRACDFAHTRLALQCTSVANLDRPELLTDHFGRRGRLTLPNVDLRSGSFKAGAC
jgi:hypothetical protein